VSKPSSGPSSASPAAGSSATQTRQKGSAKAPETPGVARIIAIANQKGGVGKSTTAVSLGAALADLGYRVLVVDLDPQGNASTGMGIKHENRQVTAYDVIVAESPVSDAIVHSPIERLDAVTSTIDLAGAEIELVSQFSREGRLKRALEPVREGVYDFVFLDCPPSLGLITINALTAAEELVVPIQCEYYALEGLGQLLRNVSLVQQNINPELRLTGIVMTMFDPRTKLSEQVVAEVRRFFGDLVYDSIIPRTVRLSEAPGFGLPITAYDPKSKGAQSYRALAREVADRPPPEMPMPHYDDVPTIVVPTLGTDTPAGDEEALEQEEPAEEEVAAEEPVVAEQPPPPPERPPERATNQIQAESSPDESSAPAVPREAAQPAPAVPSVPEPQAAVDEDELWEPADRADAARVRPVTDAAPGELPQRRVVVIDDDAQPGPAGDRRPPNQPPAPPASTVGETLRDDDEGQRRRWRLFRKGGE
jgi:chromosome partitioning protein